jgi:hypothetical protein
MDVTSIMSDHTVLVSIGTAEEQRTAPRLPCDQMAACFLHPADELRWARVTDLSAEGVRLVMSGPMRPGVPLVVRLRGRGRPSVVTQHAWVVHCTLGPDGSWTVGCRFDTPLAAETLRALA